MRIRDLMFMLSSVAVTAACGGLQQEDATPEPTAATETAYVNGRIYTQDPDLPWAESFVTRGDRIVFVGTTEDALQYADGDARSVDLQNRFVMPGVIDAHTHPGLIATGADLSVLDAAEGNETPANADRMPSRPREATLAWLRQYAADHPFALVIRQGVWDLSAYLPNGPHKRDLDEISSLRPIILNDNSGHSVWVNSAFLRLFGIDRDTPDVSSNLSHFVRDENGEPTGWVKEFALLPYFGDRFVPDADELKERLLQYLNYMSSQGITTSWDAGSFNMNDAVYRAAHDIAREGRLPLRWEGSYHIWAPEQIDTAVASLMRLREKYAHGKLQFNTIKIHYDGMQDILTAAMLEPYVTDPDNSGAVLFTTQRLSAFMQELDAHGIHLHLHSSGDRATRNILDAVEQARESLGRPLGIEVTLSHLFSVADSDIGRFQELGRTRELHPTLVWRNIVRGRSGDQRGTGARQPVSACRAVHAARGQRHTVQRCRLQCVAGEPLHRYRSKHDPAGTGRCRCCHDAAAGCQDLVGTGAGWLYRQRRCATRIGRRNRRHKGRLAGGLHCPATESVRNRRGDNPRHRGQRHNRGR